jgi:hypothetical protein
LSYIFQTVMCLHFNHGISNHSTTTYRAFCYGDAILRFRVGDCSVAPLPAAQ